MKTIAHYKVLYTTLGGTWVLWAYAMTKQEAREKARQCESVIRTWSKIIKKDVVAH